MLLRWEQGELAERSGVPLPTLSKLEMRPGALVTRGGTAERLRQALESAGVIFVAENGEGPGVRLRKVPGDA